MKYRLFSLSLSLLLLQPALAASSDKPEKCPSVAAIAAIGVDDASLSMAGWVAFPSNSNYYDTREAWSFGIIVPASNKNEALQLARANLGSLSVMSDPVQTVTTNKGWSCYYKNQQDYYAVAFTPPSTVRKQL